MNCCHDEQEEYVASEGGKRFLLVGNPNVGKSVIFSKLTGKEVMTANYAGTTVSYTLGSIFINNQEHTLIDVPGVYSLRADSEAERVAVDFIDEGADAIIFVLDATNLNQSLQFAYQIKKIGIPTIYALNLVDVAERKGIEIDVKKLSNILGAPVIETIAPRNVGLNLIIAQLGRLIRQQNQKQLKTEDQITDEEVTYEQIETIVENVQTFTEKRESFLDKVGDWSMKPLTGIPIALLLLAISFAVVIGGGKGLRAAILLPFIKNIYTPFITSIIDNFVSPGMLHNILVGEYGVLIKGIEWPFALILPYVFFFYIILSFLEDSGYLPRLGALMDGILSKMGVQGSNIVPFIMGYGCAVPAIIGTRTSSSRKERLIVATVVSVSIPCASQTGAFVALLAEHSVGLLFAVFFISIVFAFLAGFVVDRLIPGKSTPLFMEIPNFLIPDRKTLFKKISQRTKGFMLEAQLPMFIGIGIAALVVETGLLVGLSDVVKPVVEQWLGLPPEASLSLMLGFIRRELAVLPLIELGLTTSQLFVGSIIALLYLPCISVFGILVKEFGLKIAGILSAATIFLAVFVGGLFNHLFKLFSLIF